MSDLAAIRDQIETSTSGQMSMLTYHALTELIEEVETLRARVDKLQAGTNEFAPLPDECRNRQCTYFTHYLAQGPADLTHDGFHEAEKKCAYWQQKAFAWLDEHMDNPQAFCPYEHQCDRWEKAIRA